MFGREGESNRFSRRSLKFAVRVIMLIDIGSYNVRDEILLLIESIFRGGKMFEFSTLGDRQETIKWSLHLH